MSDDFGKYAALRRSGLSALEVHRAAQEDGLDEFATFRMLREVFDLSFVEAKRVIVSGQQDEGALEQQQGKLLPGIERALQETESND